MTRELVGRMQRLVYDLHCFAYTSLCNSNREVNNLGPRSEVRSRCTVFPNHQRAFDCWIVPAILEMEGEAEER